MINPVFIAAYDYLLPSVCIAAAPEAQRDASKLLVYRRGAIADDTFYHLPHYLPANSMLVLNDTRVIEARLFFQKPTGGVIEIFCLEPFAPAGMEEALQQTEAVRWRCLVGGASKWSNGQILEKPVTIGATSVTLQAVYINKEADGFIIELRWTGGALFSEVLQAAGAVPLPPYIKRSAEASDAERYQTVFAAHNGSVAAPTASLHFTHGVFKKLDEKKITRAHLTLHVGAGTFKPVKTETIDQHHMHSETFSVRLDFLKKLLDAETIIAAGTTSLRTLESLHWLGVKLLVNGDLKTFALAQWEAYQLPQHITYNESIEALINHLMQNNRQELHARTSLLIVPGYLFRSATALITNFHQPRSTLLLLIAAFVGNDWKKIYHHAMENHYRFLSYGDSSLLWRTG